MKTMFLFLVALSGAVQAQNVGIGSLSPQKKLTVNGSILLDENNTNDGAIDSAALLFGTNGEVGIASKKTSAGWQNGLSFFTSAQNRMTITPTGSVGINMISPLSPLHVAGTIRSTTDIWAAGLGRFDGRLAIGGAGLPEYKLYNNGSSYFGGNVNITGTTALSGALNVAGLSTLEGLRLNGNMAINGPVSGGYAIFVHNLPSYFNGPITATGSATFNSSVNVGGDGIIENNFRVNGRVGINGATNANYGLIVNNANSYFDGNATVQGSTNLQGSVTIQGKGHVRSNGVSSLRIGFTSTPVFGLWDAHQERIFYVYLPDFDGTPDNIRVNISQFEPAAGSDNSDFKWYVYDVDSASDTAKIRVINQANGIRGLEGTFYLMIVVKD